MCVQSRFLCSYFPSCLQKFQFKCTEGTERCFVKSNITTGNHIRLLLSPFEPAFKFESPGSFTKSKLPFALVLLESAGPEQCPYSPMTDAGSKGRTNIKKRAPLSHPWPINIVRSLRGGAVDHLVRVFWDVRSGGMGAFIFCFNIIFDALPHPQVQ